MKGKNSGNGVEKKQRRETNKNAKAIKEFTDTIMKKHKKVIKSMWLFTVDNISVSRDFTVILLLNDIEQKYNIADISATIKMAKSGIEKRYGIKLHAGYYKVTEYFEKIMENDLDIFNELKNSIPIYDSGGFFRPLKKLLEKGEILGTKESLMRLGEGITAHFKNIHSMKLNIMENLFNAVVDSGQALLISRKYPIPLQTQIPEMLSNVFAGKDELDKRYIKYCRDIIKVYKDMEHETKKDLRGWELDILTKKAEEFVKRVRELMGEDQKFFEAYQGDEEDEDVHSQEEGA